MEYVKFGRFGLKVSRLAYGRRTPARPSAPLSGPSSGDQLHRLRQHLRLRGRIGDPRYVGANGIWTQPPALIISSRLEPGSSYGRGLGPKGPRCPMGLYLKPEETIILLRRRIMSTMSSSPEFDDLRERILQKRYRAFQYEERGLSHQAADLFEAAAHLRRKEHRTLS